MFAALKKSFFPESKSSLSSAQKIDLKRVDPRSINADLHCHSQVSDGTLTPTELAQRAHAHGVEAWALTDHDEVGGQREAAAAAQALGMAYIPGVEISVSWAHETIHIVGLRIDPECSELLQGLAATRAGRAVRAQAIGEQLAAAGIDDAFEGAKHYVSNPELISRTHFARYLVERGYCASVREVFNKYLVPGKPGYVPTQWAKLGEAVGWIKAAGGIAIVAHPGRYKLSDPALRSFFDEFQSCGGTAIEVITGSHTVDQYRKFATLAKMFGFMASRGSDFHGPAESRVELGSLPQLPDSVMPVWHDWF